MMKKSIRTLLVMLLIFTLAFPTSGISAASFGNSNTESTVLTTNDSNDKLAVSSTDDSDTESAGHSIDDSNTGSATSSADNPQTESAASSADNPNAGSTASSTDDSSKEAAATVKRIKGTISASDIDKDGNVHLSISNDKFSAAGYEYGDIVKVKILGRTYKIPYISSPADVDTGKAALIGQDYNSNLALIINMGDFATTYGLATKTTLEDGSFEWNYAEGISGPIKVSIRMKKKAGYLKEYSLHKQVSTNERADYPELSDEEFANFRNINTTGMGLGVLYRTSSPINPELKRNTYADKALKDAGITVVVNLADTEAEIKEYEGFSESYYATTKYTALGLNTDFSSKEFKEKLRKGLRFMADNPGIYAIHCTEGKDRAGFVAALLECLMGADYIEVIYDYMLSYSNYYKLERNDPAYELIAGENLKENLTNAFTFKEKDRKKDLETRNLSACAEKYLKKIGLTKDEIQKLKSNLSANLPFLDKKVPLKHPDGSVTPLILRFYPDQPNIPYIGIKEYSDFMGNPLSVSKDRFGNLIFKNTQGIEAVADIEAGTIYCDCLTLFHNPALPYEGDAIALKDSGCRFVRISDIVLEGEGDPVTFDFKKYGLKMYAAEQDVYMSLTMVASLLADISTKFIIWNGIRAYSNNFSTLESELSDIIYSSPLYMKILNNSKRADDIADETYKELCFSLDYLRGHPGSAVLDQALKTEEFHKSLLYLGDDGKDLIEGLSSTYTATYYNAAIKLFLKYLDDGHTVPYILYSLYFNTFYPELSPEGKAELDDLDKQFCILTDLSNQIDKQRSKIWGDDVYREYGNTAIIRLADFLLDEEGWEQFYDGTGDIPADAVGITISGLRQASQNPEIKNILFDLSTNAGGNSDALAYIMILTFGDNRLRLYDELSHQTYACIFEADTNLDGLIDEKDRDLVYDQFNYGVLTSKEAFSCGNIFPIKMQEAGAVLLGEPTGGGTCEIQFGFQPDGTFYYISSAQTVLIDKNGENVESGCKTDLPIKHKEKITKKGIKYDYSAYFDEQKLVDMLNEWFGEEESKAS